MEKKIMKLWKGLVLGLALVLLTASPILAKDKGAETSAKAEKSALRGEYAIMASVCQMTDAQKAELEAVLKVKNDTLTALEEENRNQKKRMVEAEENGDKELQERIREEGKALKDRLLAIEADYRAKIAAVLTPEQGQAWEGFKLYRALMRRYSKAELDGGQKAKVRALANEAAKKMLAVTGTGKEAEDARNEIEQELKASVENDVLTAEQKEKMKPAAKKPKEKAGEEGGEAPAEM